MAVTYRGSSQSVTELRRLFKLKQR